MTIDHSLVAVVVTYNRPKELASMLDSIRSQTVQPSFVAIVDNSDAGMAVHLDECPVLAGQVQVARTGCNLGPAGGFQEGLRVASDVTSWEWALLLDDDDPFLHVDTLERLVRRARRDRKEDSRLVMVGLAGAILNRKSGRLRSSWGSNAPIEVDYIGGGFHPLLHSSAMKPPGCGPFNPDLFFGFEELDAGLRLQGRGKRILAYDDLAHELGYAGRFEQPRLSVGATSARRFYSWRNMIYVARTNRLWMVLVASLVRVALSGLVRSLTQRSLAPARLAAEALLHGLAGRLGAAKSLPSKSAQAAA